MSQFLHGLHDAGGEFLMGGRPGWVVVTEEIGADPAQASGRDYGTLQPHTPIVRLNFSHSGQGTLPSPARYGAFAQTCAAWVAKSQGCVRWIIGNEPNHRNEWPGGDILAILPLDYAAAFNLCRAAIRAAQPDAQVIVAAVAPWNLEAGDWLTYWRTMLAAIPAADGLGGHIYTHGADPALVSSEERRHGWYWHLRVYRDLLGVVPVQHGRLPVYVTETNQGDDAWADENRGWVQAAYGEIEAWNRQPDTQKIHALCLYRWADHDKWSIQAKPQVQADFQAAVARGFLSPSVGAAAQPPGNDGAAHTAFVPVVVAGAAGSAVPGLPPREWDGRLDKRGVTLREYGPLYAGQVYWRVAAARWLDREESQGKHHILVDVLDEAGRRVVGARLEVRWPGGAAEVVTEAKAGEPWATSFPMSPSRNEFSISVLGNGPSDVLAGIGMGMATGDGGFNAGEHTSTAVVFRLTRHAGQAAPTAAPSPVTPGPAAPAEPPKIDGGAVVGVIDPLALEALMEVESGGQGFENGRAKVRVEAHLLLGQTWGNPQAFGAHFSFNRDNILEAWFRWTPAGQWIAYHGDQKREQEALALASRLDEAAAIRCTSWGVGQVMGFHWKKLGYGSERAFRAAMERTHAAQVVAMVNYCLADPALVRALNARDWYTVIRKYNGVGMEAVYRPRLLAALARLRGGQ